MSDVLVEITRRDVRSGDEHVESEHRGHVALVDGDGRLVASVGDPEHLTYVRSAVKPFQARACLRLLGERAGALTDEEIAVGWASHRAEPGHLTAIRRLLARSSTPEDALTCPPDRSIDDPCLVGRIAHNCSGKHALFALAGEAVGCPRERLLDPDGPLQTAVLAELADAVGRPRAVAVDGCGAPAVAVPLAGLARGFASLPGDPVGDRVLAAGLAHPGLVGGAGRAESALLAAGVVAKPGAEGVFAAAWDTPNGRLGERLGAAVKITDGAGRAAAALIVALVGATGGPPVSWDPEPPLGGGRPAGLVRVRPGALRALASGH